MTTRPRSREAEVVLQDGSTVHLCRVTPCDTPTMHQLLTGLSDRSRWLRFFSGVPNLHKAVQWATEVDNDRRYGLVATAGGDGQTRVPQLIGVLGFSWG
jgi:hypothetical protein